MANVAETRWPDEADTRKTEAIPASLLSFASKVDRLVANALERLLVADADALAGAVGDLLEVQELTGQVLR